MFSTATALNVASHSSILLALIVMLLWMRRWPLLFAFSVWPGTVAHELLHYLAGLITGAKPVSLSVIPRRTLEGGWVLGSVAFANLRWWNSALVGLAPMMLLPGSAYLFVESITTPLLSTQSTGIKLVAAQCLIASWPSPRDWSHAIVGLVIAGLIAVIGFLLPMKMGVL